VAKAQARTTTGEIVLPGSGNATHVICAAYDYDREVVHPLLSLLPPVLFVHGDGGPERDAVRHALQLLHRELTSPSAGSAIIIDRLIDVRFVHVLHAWVDGQNDHGRSRLLGLRNPSIARALDDAVSTIAHRVGYTSEFAFSRALSRLRGRPPGRYRAEARGRRDQSGPELRAVVGSR
jgi:AraC-like DNA-binding protein